MSENQKLSHAKFGLLGFQHMFAMFGATVLVPALTGLSVSATLLFAGLGTLLFHLISKGKVPAFLGSSFAFLGGYFAIAGMEQFADGTINWIPYAGVGVACAGLIYCVVAALFKVFGAEKVMRFFPPIVTGPIIIAIGITLANTAINSCMASWPIALVAIAVVIICNIWGKGMIKIIPILLSVVVSYIVALVTGAVDFTSVAMADLLGSPVIPANFAKFDISAIITIMPIALAAMMEHIGDIAAISATTGENYIEDPGLHRTLLGDGLATSFAGFIGGPANTTYGENTGVLALTKVYDPAIVRLAAVIAVILSCVPKFDAVVNSIPAAIIGGISLILYGMISAVGVRNIVENKIDFTNSRNLIIAAVILVSALGFNSTGGITFAVAGATITLSGLAIAAILGIALNAILPGTDYEFGKKAE